MRNLLLLSLVAVLGCSTTPLVTADDIVPVVFEEGPVLDTPCDIHGSHVYILTSSEVVRIYTFTNDQGEESIATAGQIQDMLDRIALDRDLREALDLDLVPGDD